MTEEENIKAHVELKEMNIHETKIVGQYEILRVTDGWIYTHREASSSVFVPLRSF